MEQNEVKPAPLSLISTDEVVNEGQKKSGGKSDRKSAPIPERHTSESCTAGSHTWISDMSLIFVAKRK
ncbi:hypothetical protein MKX64_07305 [Paenibacillus sp. FSL M8-0334]|uniref:hypothetical protein n=1 Tax=Paenibacillus sp. FSL M8-0334 TaxID=2921623 RepID=UPI0030F80F29